MQSDAHECNPNVVCLILTDLQTREIHIKNMTPPEFYQKQKWDLPTTGVDPVALEL